MHYDRKIYEEKNINYYLNKCIFSKASPILFTKTMQIFELAGALPLSTFDLPFPNNMEKT